MSQEQIDILQRALKREKAARKSAEKILESKSAELYELTQELKNSNLQLQKLIKEKTSELKGVFHNIVDPYVVMDLWGNVIRMNAPAVALLGYDNSVEEFNLLSLADPSEADHIMEGFQTLIQHGSITNFEVNINTRENNQKLVHINASVILDDFDNPVAAQGIVRDITKDREAEEQLIESENRLATLILNLDSGMLLEDENRKIVLTNTKFCELFSIPMTPDQMVGQDCSDSAEYSKSLFLNPEEFVSKINTIVKDKKTVLGDELQTVSGLVLERDYIPIFKNDDYKGHLWSYRDITLKRKYRQSIEVQRQKYRDIIANMNLGLVEVDNDDKVLMINQSFSEMCGYEESELLGKKGSDVLPIEGGADKINEENGKRQNGQSNSYEIKVKTKSGDIRHWLISGAPNYNLNGEIVGSIGIHLDITDLKSLQHQKEKLLLKLEKSNDELQEYAHIVSHDLKSPLRSIYALVSWLKEDNRDKLDENSMKNINHIENSLEKMEQLITDVLNYSSAGADVTDKIDVDTNVIIHDLIKLLYIPDHIKIHVLKPLPVIIGDQTKLQQLFQNLISNAVKFIDKEQGSIEIDVKDQEHCFLFSIKDNGIGIEKKFHDKIFKIFHSLNKSKDSTGIGLSIVKKIVNLHEGEIWLESEPQIGTTFFFTLKKDR